MGVVCDNLDVELALVRRIKEKKVGSQFKVDGSRPGGGLPIFTRCRIIFFTSSGSVVTVSIFMGEPPFGHLRYPSGHLRPSACPDCVRSTIRLLDKELDDTPAEAFGHL